ncbi:Nuclear receptor coactivator 6 [Holothuria leucospilota]|uniref:Nuclear receptor coactivator 6 n=1 Tax=Holothuria leucospilota TaxID=206669 RepID=A0A9Q1BTG1_HOLLE|nr:Nuclear receptor coactivator 6 [Holothuria leucospilota]
MADITEVVITCKGNVNDPDIHEKISKLLEDISSTAGADNANLKSLEPWNSIKVTFNIPREAAIRLQELARLGDDALVNLGILSVQIANGELFDLNAIRQLLQQQEATPPPSRLLPQQLPQSSADTVVPAPPQGRPKPQVHKKKKAPAVSSSPQMPAGLPAINLGQQPLPHTSSPLSSVGVLPSHTTLSSSVSSGTSLLPAQPPMSSSSHKSPFLMNSGPMLSIGNIPPGIPSPYLGNLSKTTAISGNIAMSNSFSSVYSIAMSVGGSSRVPHQAPVLQSLPNLPTPQTPPGSFPWNLGAKPPPFMTNRQPSGMSPWNQMYPGGSNLPTNLPGSIPSIGPIPSPSNLANSRPDPPAPQSKPKKKQVKKVKRNKKVPKDKMPSIPLPPPLMPPEPKVPPTSETMAPPKPVGLPIAMNPISPNTPPSTSIREGTPTPGTTPVSSQTQPIRFPFNQAQMQIGGRSDVSMTSPLLVDLLQRDIPSTQFPLTSGESMKGTVSGPVSSSPHRMPAPIGQPQGHSAVTMHLPNTTAPQLGVVTSQMTAPRSLVQQPPMFRQPMQMPMRSPMGQPQQSTPGTLPNTNMAQKLNQTYQQQAYPQIPYSPSTSGGIPQGSNRMPMPQINFPHGNMPPFMIPHGVSQAGHSMQLPHPQSQGNWPVPPPSAMTTVPAVISSEAVFTSTPSVSAMRRAGQSQLDGQPQRALPKQRDPVVKSAFDEESALAGMTEAERDTFVAAAKIAQDSKPTSTSETSRGGSQPGNRPPSNAEQFANLPIPSEGFSFTEKSLPSMLAVENLAVSEPQQPSRASKSFTNSGPRERLNEKPSPSPSPSLTPSPSSFISHRSTPTDGNKSSAIITGADGPHGMTSVPAVGQSRQTISLNDFPPSSLSQIISSKSTSASMQAKPVQMQGGQPSMPPLCFPSLPSSTFPSQVSEQRGPFPSSVASVGSVSLPNVESHGTQNWPSGSAGSKRGDSFQLESKRKMQSYDYSGKQNAEPALPPKAPGGYPYDWPFNTIAPPTQSLSTEGLQFMARLAAIPQDSDRSQEKSQHPHQELQKSGKEDKPHLKALLNEISGGAVSPASSGCADGQSSSSRGLKRLSSEEKTERKRRKSSPRPSSDQHTPSSQPHGKGDHPSGSLELPRVPTAEELSFNLQQARAQSLDLLKGASNYTPMPKSGPSSPRGKGRTKSSDHPSQGGMQHAESYKGKPFASVPTSTTVTGASGKTSGGVSKSSSKSKDSRSRSKSPKASGSKSHKSDGSSYQGVTPAPTSSNVPFAGVHEFHPPPGLTIRGPAKPGPPQFQTRKVPQVSDEPSPMSPTIPPYGPTPYQPPRPFPPPETQRKSPRASRPVSPFASASALLSSFAMSAGKVPEFPVTKPGQSQSPLTSPSYVTSPPLQHLPVTSLPSGSLGVSHSGIMGEGVQLEQSDDFKAMALTPQGGHQPVPQFALTSQDPKLDHGFFQREPVGVAPGRIVQSPDGWPSNWTDAAPAESKTHSSVPSIPFGNPREVPPALWKPQATAASSETERRANTSTLPSSSGGSNSGAGTSFSNLPTSSFYHKSNEETSSKVQPNVHENLENQRTTASSVSSGIEDKRKPAGGPTTSAAGAYSGPGMEALSSSPDVPTSLVSSYPDESNPYFYQPHRSPIQSEAQGKVRPGPVLSSGALNPKFSSGLTSSGGDVGVQKSVIVVSSQKPNVTTIGVRKVGTIGHQQYSVPNHSQSGMTGVTSYETSHGYSARPSNVDTIGRNGASNMPQTRVTKVIPITQENMLSWQSNKTWETTLERDQMSSLSTTENPAETQLILSTSSGHDTNEAPSAYPTLVNLSKPAASSVPTSSPTTEAKPQGANIVTVPSTQLTKMTFPPIVSESFNVPATTSYSEKGSIMLPQSHKPLERESSSRHSQQQTTQEADRMLSLASTQSDVTPTESLSSSSIAGAKELSPDVSEEKSEMCNVFRQGGPVVMTSRVSSSPRTIEHLTSTPLSTISASFTDNGTASVQSDPLDLPKDPPTQQSDTREVKSKSNVIVSHSSLTQHSSKEGAITVTSSESGSIHQDISAPLPKSFEKDSLAYRKDTNDTGERSNSGMSLDTVSDAAVMLQDPLNSKSRDSNQSVEGVVSQVPVPVESSMTPTATSLDVPNIAQKFCPSNSIPSQDREAQQVLISEEHQTRFVAGITPDKYQTEPATSQESSVSHGSKSTFGMSSAISSDSSGNSSLQHREEEAGGEADVYGFKGCEEEDDPLDRMAEDYSKDNNSASYQSDRMEYISQEDFQEHELDADQDESLLQEDDTLMQKNRNRGQRSPGACGQDGRDGSGSQEEDQDQPKTRKRSMRASGRDMYYGPIPTYKRRKPNQK